MKRTSTPSSSSATFAFPYIALLVSGGHTSLFRVAGWEEMRLLGGTRDDAAGEAFDKAAKMMGLPLSRRGRDRPGRREGDAARFHFPRAWLSRDSADFSFSGLKTALRTFLASPEGKAARMEDVAASFQEAVVDVLVGKAIDAARARAGPAAGAVRRRLGELPPARAGAAAGRRGGRRDVPSLRRRCAPTTPRWWRCSASGGLSAGSPPGRSSPPMRPPGSPADHPRGGPSPPSACPPASRSGRTSSPTGTSPARSSSWRAPSPRRSWRSAPGSGR